VAVIVAPVSAITLSTPNCNIGPLPGAPAPRRSWIAHDAIGEPECQATCRIPRALDSGMWVFRLRGRWTTWHSRLANRIVGNPKSAAGLELTGKGPMLQFGVDSVIALTGATMTATLEASAFRSGSRSPSRGQCADARRIDGPGQRAYLAVKGGFDVPEYLGSRSNVHARAVWRPRRTGIA